MGYLFHFTAKISTKILMCMLSLYYVWNEKQSKNEKKKNKIKKKTKKNTTQTKEKRKMREDFDDGYWTISIEIICIIEFYFNMPWFFGWCWCSWNGIPLNLTFVCFVGFASIPNFKYHTLNSLVTIYDIILILMGLVELTASKGTVTAMLKHLYVIFRL